MRATEWDQRYAEKQQWSAGPNALVAELLTGLPAGDAVDLAAGEGRHALWLASRGWRVTAVDVSPVVLERAANRAAEAGEQIAARITWQQADALTWEPAPRQFDLVSAQFMYLPPVARDSLYRRLAAAVRPGGTLLIVGHHPSDLETSVGRPNLPDFLFTADQIAATLEPDDWQFIVAAAPERQTLDPDGRPVTIHDAVLRAQRRK
jgi:SAM-dependent methyltransferase